MELASSTNSPHHNSNRSNHHIPTPSITPPTLQQHVNYSSEHKVYILSCAHCGCFISDRGMKAVLLLRPSITLFSTDGMPYNCGPLYPDGDDAMGYTEQVERTCDCLTQSIGCFGCGNTIGYHIICPCSRCVDSVSKHRRTANGHRWVFHYGEVISQERRYVENEPGIYNARCIIKHQVQRTDSMLVGTSNSMMLSESLQETMNEDESREREAIKTDNLDGYGYELPLGIYDTSLNSLHSSNLSNSRIVRRSRPTISSKFALKQGDTIYWHHLTTTGERPLPVFAPPHPICSRPAR